MRSQLAPRENIFLLCNHHKVCIHTVDIKLIFSSICLVTYRHGTLLSPLVHWIMVAPFEEMQPSRPVSGVYASFIMDFQLNIITAITLWLAVTTGGFLYLLSLQNAANIRYGFAISLLFFNNLNILISFCEIALGKHIMLIREDYQKLKLKYSPKKEEIQALRAFVFTPFPWNRLFDGKLWSRMWSTYALYDPSYQNYESFGFFIDVGNGWSSIPPCLLMNLAISAPQYCNALFVGCICIASYWQVLYGTIIYLLSFISNKRYQGFKTAEIVGFVGVSNGIWLFFPLLGIYACVCILDRKDFSVFGHA